MGRRERDPARRASSANGNSSHRSRQDQRDTGAEELKEGKHEDHKSNHRGRSSRGSYHDHHERGTSSALLTENKHYDKDKLVHENVGLPTQQHGTYSQKSTNLKLAVAKASL